MAKLTIHPPGTPLPPGHPFATPRILFGQKRPALPLTKPIEPVQSKPDKEKK